LQNSILVDFNHLSDVWVIAAPEKNEYDYLISVYFNHLSDVWVIAANLDNIEYTISILFQSSF